MLTIIHNDHIKMSQLLTILRKRIECLERDENIDYRLIKSVISYLRDYSDKYHHPMEDLIYDYYLEHYEADQHIALRLSEEHRLIKDVTIDLDELLEMILLDAIVPKEVCIEKLTQFVSLQSTHLDYEEQHILPLIEKNLTPDDWVNIDKQWHYKDYNDPLFGKNVLAQYKELSDVIKK